MSPRTPLAIAEATGRTSINPARFAGRADPAVAPLPPEPPAWLSFEDIGSYALLAEICPWARLSDQVHLGMTAQLFTKLRAGMLRTDERAQLIRCLALLGMNPADRSRVTMPPPAPDGDPDL
jgi:hypothetical protein